MTAKSKMYAILSKLLFADYKNTWEMLYFWASYKMTAHFNTWSKVILVPSDQTQRFHLMSKHDYLHQVTNTVTKSTTIRPN